MLPRREQHRLQLREVIKEFQRFPGDVGSSEVQGECQGYYSWWSGMYMFTSTMVQASNLTLFGIVMLRYEIKCATLRSVSLLSISSQTKAPVS